jgi:hypothetical protein
MARNNNNMARNNNSMSHNNNSMVRNNNSMALTITIWHVTITIIRPLVIWSSVFTAQTMQAKVKAMCVVGNVGEGRRVLWRLVKRTVKCGGYCGGW